MAYHGVQKKRSLTRKQRRARQRLKSYQEWREDHPHPTPYHEWPEYAGWCSERVQSALGSQPLPSWSNGPGRNDVLLTVTDLAVGYWAVKCTSGKGTSGGQLRRCFKVCVDRSCHHSKAKIIFATLMAVGLIQKTANYYVGKRGNVYEEVLEGKIAKPFVKKLVRLSEPCAPLVERPDAMDNPFAAVESARVMPIHDLFKIPADGSNIFDD